MFVYSFNAYQILSIISRYTLFDMVSLLMTYLSGTIINAILNSESYPSQHCTYVILISVKTYVVIRLMTLKLLPIILHLYFLLLFLKCSLQIKQLIFDEHFKSNSAMVALDFLYRHKFIDKDSGTYYFLSFYIYPILINLKQRRIRYKYVSALT